MKTIDEQNRLTPPVSHFSCGPRELGVGVSTDSMGHLSRRSGVLMTFYMSVTRHSANDTSSLRQKAHAAPLHYTG